jgi:hypothetical protein
MFIMKLTIILCFLGLHDHPQGEWVDLEVATSTTVVHVLQDEAKTYPPRQCALFHVSVCVR